MTTTTSTKLTRSRTALVTVAIVCLLTVACSSATIISYIDSALQIALEFVPLAVPGLPPAVTSYFQAGLSCVDFAATEVATGDSNAVKSAKITAQCATLVQADLPVGTPQNLVSLASRLATKIADILTHLPAPAPATPSGTLAASGKPVHMKLKPADVSKLTGISARAKAAKTQIGFKTDSSRKP